MTGPLTSRRIVFQGLGALGVAAVLAGCGGSSGEPPPKSGAALARTSDVPVGGGVVLLDENVVITQPTAGDFKAFIPLCTHQGAALSRVGDEGIECPLHGSRFSITDGSATNGPATSPLTPVPITVSGDQILAA
ncbi:hypothetical protein BH11ACT8_BH11ACT8_17880 [soil metagenome]